MFYISRGRYPFERYPQQITNMFGLTFIGNIFPKRCIFSTTSAMEIYKINHIFAKITNIHVIKPVFPFTVKDFKETFFGKIVKLQDKKLHCCCFKGF